MVLALYSVAVCSACGCGVFTVCLADFVFVQKNKKIVAGSIRPPHRMIHVVKTEGHDRCDHPHCNGARNDTLHMFWICKKWELIRKKYVGALEAFINKIHNIPNHLGKERAKKMRALLKTPCFQQCGICPGDVKDAQEAAQVLEQENDEVTHFERQLVGAEDCTEDENINGILHHKIYTDGSCFNGTDRLLARAGWAVWYGTNSKSNIGAPLCGPVQTSYRAELRAILHVVRTAIDPVLVMCD